MIKKKIVSFAAAALAACSITATAFAAGVYTIPKTTSVEGQSGETTQPKIKDDNFYAVMYVDSGLNSGTTFLEFSVIDDESGNVAAGPEELWVNGRCVMNYKTDRINKYPMACFFAAVAVFQSMIMTVLNYCFNHVYHQNFYLSSKELVFNFSELCRKI